MIFPPGDRLWSGAPRLFPGIILAFSGQTERKEEMNMAMTPRENALTALEHRVPERIVNLLKDANMLATYILAERAPAVPGRPYGSDGVDWFGVHWKYEEVSGAPMVDPNYPPMMDDITEWETVVKFPDLSKYDFKAEAEKELNSPMYDPDKLNQVTIMQGPFERLLSLMSTEDALCALLMEPEACAAFFNRVADHKIELIDRLAEAYPIDLIDLHDDWGTQKSTFMSVDTWKELLAEPMGRIIRHGKEKGIHIQVHSCGKIEPLLPEMIAIGLEHWSSCQGMNDIPTIVHTYGDRMTFFGCMDTPEVQARGVTQEEIDRLTAERIDLICRGGAVFPLGNSTVPGLRAAVDKALAAREDFFTKPENRVLP